MCAVFSACYSNVLQFSFSISLIYLRCITWTGALMGNRVRCPWHGACFNITTGDIEEFPGLDSLPTYKVMFPDNNLLGNIPPMNCISVEHVFFFFHIIFKVKVENGKVHVTINKKVSVLRISDCHNASSMWYMTT